MSLKPLCAIACGGTGGHLFPGLAVAEELIRNDCDVSLLISKKEIDHRAIATVAGMSVFTLPAVGLTRGTVFEFCRGFAESLLLCRRLFRQHAPQAVLAMGGFTSAPPVLAGKSCGALTFLHESNTIPGRANRWLSHIVDVAFVGFPSAANRLRTRNVITSGTPVRPQFQPADPAACRLGLGLDAQRPVLLVMGGSQGAAAINRLVEQTLPSLTTQIPELQYVHLTGSADCERAREAYQGLNCRAVVRPFLTEIELALGAATVVISRAGASSLAELAAMRSPSILIPYPTAADNHQLYNARAFAEAGAALLLEQGQATPAKLLELILNLLREPGRQSALRDELIRWHAPQAAEQIAQRIMAMLRTFGLAGSAPEIGVLSGAEPERSVAYP
jgi:UDP-N-acetylglucosamine--N-acetylmuramyl-(pentapeptide) pyrophosphoryl-undecaprenol N-acetylglucosamine transferase